MADFTPRTVEFTGRFTIPASVDAAFELFSPLGERAWVPGWNPELLHPRGADWEQGQIFRTREGNDDAVWVVTALDRDAHRVEYHRVEPRRYVARVRVACVADSGPGTRVTTSYTFVGLSPDGNDAIAAMTNDDY